MSATDNAAAGAALPPGMSRYPGMLKAAAILAMLIQVLDMTIANVALPHMQAALGANQDSISWVLTSYIVAAAIAIPATGWLSDHLGRRKLYLISVGGFTLSSVLCGLALNLETMVLFRILQGLFGAFLSPLGQTVMLDNTAPEKRGQAMAIFGMGVVTGPIIGPVVGGWLTENMDWRWVFFVNVPIGALAFVGLLLFLPDLKRPSRSLDVLGFVLLALGLASLQLMLDRGQHEDWFNSLEIWLELGISLSAFWMFAVHSKTSRNPLYPMTLLGNRNLMISAMLMGTVGIVMTAAMALMPIMLQSLMNYPVLDAGMLLATRGLGVMIMTGISGQVIHRVEPRLWMTVGLSMTAVSFWLMTRWNLDVGATEMALNGVLQGAGIGMLFVPISLTAFATLPAEWRTDGSGILNLTRSIGSSVGISLVVAFLARSSAESHANLVGHVTPYSLWVDPALFALPGDAVPTALALLNAEVTRQATMIAFLNDYYFMMFVSAAAIPLTLLLKKVRASHQPQEALIIE
jgi:DHA2 family multidrug resistance protein